MNVDLLLSNINRYAKLQKPDIELLTSVLEQKVVRKKEFLIRTGEICRHDYFVNKGCLKICYADDKGVECVTKFAIEGWWAIEIESFLNISPSFFYYQAVEDTELLSISRTNYYLLIDRIPAFQRFTMDRWQNAFIALQNRFIQATSRTAEEKYELFKQKYPGLDQRISLRLTASYLGITPEFLSVLRKRQVSRIS